MQSSEFNVQKLSIALIELSVELYLRLEFWSTRSEFGVDEVT